MGKIGKISEKMIVVSEAWLRYEIDLTMSSFYKYLSCFGLIKVG